MIPVLENDMECCRFCRTLTDSGRGAIDFGHDGPPLTLLQASSHSASKDRGGGRHGLSSVRGAPRGARSADAGHDVGAWRDTRNGRFERCGSRLDVSSNEMHLLQKRR